MATDPATADLESGQSSNRASLSTYRKVHRIQENIVIPRSSQESATIFHFVDGIVHPHTSKYLHEAGTADAFSSAVPGRVRLVIPQCFGVIYLHKARNKGGQTNSQRAHFNIANGARNEDARHAG